MKTPSGFVPSVDNLAPYQSAVDFFRNKLGADDTLAFTFSIHSPAEGYMEMIMQTLAEREEYGLTLTPTPNLKRPPSPEIWRIHGVSKPYRYGELTDAMHFEALGWVYDVCRYFESELVSFNYRV